jgi:hypothetical protein
MKKLICVFVVMTAAAGAAFAQGWGGFPAPQTVTVQGTLGLQNGQFILTSGNTVYFVPAIAGYVGFLDGLREGANVSIEGFVLNFNVLQIARLTVGGRTHDLFVAGGGWGGGGFASCCSYGGGFGGAGFGGRGRGRGRW